MGRPSSNNADEADWFLSANEAERQRQQYESGAERGR